MVKRIMENCRDGAIRSSQSSRLDEMQEVLENNSLEDVTWLCSLSESELDMLISLKMLVIQRAKIIGYEGLTKKFDLKMLRALGLILMEHLKQKVKDKSLGSCFDEGIAMMDFSNLAKGKVENVLSEEEIRECIGATLRERPAKRRPKDKAARSQKRAKVKRGRNADT